MTTARALSLVALLLPSLLVGGAAQAKKAKKAVPADDKAAWGESDDFNSAIGSSKSAPANPSQSEVAKPETESVKPSPSETGATVPAAVPAAVPPPAEAEVDPDRDQVRVNGKEYAVGPQTATVPPVKSTGNADSPDGVTWKASGWDVTLYGYAALNVMQDSTQSFGTATGNTIIQRRGTIRGNSMQAQATARDSRLGMRLAAPTVGGIKASVNLETDFNAVPPIEYTEANSVTNASFRMRQYYMKIETPIVDILAGQYHDLFGWGGKGFYPSTLNFLGVTGEIYHRQPQIRLSKIAGGGKAFEVEVAGAVLRPVQKSGGYPDVEGGLRLAFNAWTGARQQAYGQPGIGALAVGVSGIYRHFEVAQFLEFPGGTVPGNGGGVVFNAFIPIIPARSSLNRAWALSGTAEYSRGTGISDMYSSDLTGGLQFPALPNPTGRDSASFAPPVYTPNIDPGIVTFDGDNRLRTANWEGLVLGGQFYLPPGGRWWISGIYSQLNSTNIVEITPRPGWGGIYKHARYIDGSMFVALTSAIQLGVSFSQIDQTLGDGVKTRNYRTSFAAHMFF